MSIGGSRSIVPGLVKPSGTPSKVGRASAGWRVHLLAERLKPGASFPLTSLSSAAPTTAAASAVRSGSCVSPASPRFLSHDGASGPSSEEMWRARDRRTSPSESDPQNRRTDDDTQNRRAAAILRPMRECEHTGQPDTPPPYQWYDTRNRRLVTMCRLCKRADARRRWYARTGRVPPPLRPRDPDQCVHGHRYSESGRYASGQCAECCRIRARKPDSERPDPNARCTFCNWTPHPVGIHGRLCSNGHPLERVGRYTRGYAKGRCKECSRAASRRYRLRNLEKERKRVRDYRQKRAA